MDFPTVSATYEGFLQPLILNILLLQMQIGKFMSCGFLAGWAIFFYQDDGAVGDKCFRTGLVGAQAEFYEAK